MRKRRRGGKRKREGEREGERVNEKEGERMYIRDGTQVSLNVTSTPPVSYSPRPLERILLWPFAS